MVELRMGEKLPGVRVSRTGKVVPRLEVRGPPKTAVGQESGTVLLVDKPKANSTKWLKEGEWRSEGITGEGIVLGEGVVVREMVRL